MARFGQARVPLGHIPMKSASPVEQFQEEGRGRIAIDLDVEIHCWSICDYNRIAQTIKL